MNHRKLLYIAVVTGSVLTGARLGATETTPRTTEQQRKCVITEEVRNLSNLGCKPPAPPAPPPVPSAPQPPADLVPPVPPAPPAPPTADF